MTPRFGFVGGSLALDFVNTVGNRLHKPARRDYFRSMADVVDWAVAAGLTQARSIRGGSGSDLRRVVATRERFYRIFVAFADDLASLNDLVWAARRQQRITPTPAGFAWRWARSVPELDRVVGEIALDAAALLTSPRHTQIRQCHDDYCGWLFVDQSRSGRRRWCSMGDCGNRAKARRHYERTRERQSGQQRVGRVSRTRRRKLREA
jgi:predicted RNA-binding Zn ribbon-like protein